MISGIVTAVFMYLLYYRGWESVAAGICIGFFVYVSIAFYDLYIVKHIFKKLNLSILLLINTITHVVIIMIVAALYVGIFYLKGHFEVYFTQTRTFISQAFLLGLAFGLLLSVIFSFIGITGTIIGRHNLGKLFIGRYRKPFEEERIFMFLDITGSTSIAEQIGHLKFLSLLNDFFQDIVEPIDMTKGEIYKYVGDEAIITWKIKEGILNANCLECYRQIRSRIDKRSQYYLKHYSLVPSFKAGIHGGMAVVGEIGYDKREIAFVGDVLNTTARIVGECKTFNQSLLISEDIVLQLNKNDRAGLFEVGDVRLRGKVKEMKLYGVSAIE